MLQKFIGLLFLFFISFQTIAQYDVTFYDGFNNNKYSWSIANNSDIHTSIKSGVYEIEHKRTTASYNFWREFAIDKDKEFYIETSIKHISGVEDWGYGIVWGASSWSNSYNFLISENAYYTIGGYKNENWQTYKKWTESAFIKKGQFNKLAIRYKFGKLDFFINNHKVATLDYLPFLGNKIGFVLYHNMTIQVDYLNVQYNRRRINLVKNINPNYKKKNLGQNINSKYSEIAPIISPDGKTLYVARQNHPQNIGAQKKYDVWFATRRKDGSWNALKRMEPPINNAGDNLVIAVSPDNNTLWLEGLYTSTGKFLSDQGISISHRTADGWSVPKQIVIQDFYNRNEYESYCPTVDRKILIMSIEREDTYGEKDLYVSFRLPNGEYSKPFNMGTDLNTFFNEGTPFIAPDNKTLYFYSYGHPGYGSADIFVSKRLDNSWRKWSKPQNLGPTINSNAWDTYYSISAKGDYAYLVSSKNSYGNEDVFEIKMSEEAKPDPVVLLSGKVFNKKTKKPVGVKIIYEDLSTGAKVGSVKSSAQDGTYKIILPYGKKYGIIAESVGYIAVNEHLDLTKVSKYQEIKKYLYLVPIETGQVINLKNIQFKKSKAEFLETSYSELNRLVQLMKMYPKMEIELSGHTDTRGKPDLLLDLSQKRVDAVKNYLVKHGIDASRISGKGYGGTKPLGTGSEEIEMKNRRVEFKIKKM
jgi:outer membrane protein OmpA-like peptidoglycan-associated protein